jgi:hypothetical protein
MAIAVELQFPKCFASLTSSYPALFILLGSRPLIVLSTVSLKTFPLIIVNSDNCGIFSHLKYLRGVILAIIKGTL